MESSFFAFFFGTINLTLIFFTSSMFNYCSTVIYEAMIIFITHPILLLYLFSSIFIGHFVKNYEHYACSPFSK